MVEDKNKVPQEIVPEKKEVPKVEDRYELTEVVTQTGIAVKDNDTEKIFTQDDLLVEILNKIDKLERAMA